METPDRCGREAILKVHVSKKELPLADDVDLGDIASMTTGSTGYLSFSDVSGSCTFLLSKSCFFENIGVNHLV